MAQRKGGFFSGDPARSGEAAAESEGIGTLLRRRREGLGQDVAGVSRQLRIRAVYITAIEEGRLYDLPGTAYAVGFVRAYADYLGLDGNAIVGDYREELAQRSRQNDLVWPAEEAVQKFPGGTILVICALIAVAGYAGWYYATQPGGTGFQLIDAVPEYIKKATGVGEAAPAAEAPTPAPDSATATPTSAAPASVPAPAPEAIPSTDGQTGGQTSSQAAPALPTEDLPSAAAGTPGATPGSSPGSSPASPAAEGTTDVLPSPDAADAAGGEADAAQAGAEPGAPAAPAVAEPDQSATAAVAGPLPAARIVVRADHDSWVEIRDAVDAVILQRVLRQGESFNVPDEPGLVMNTGNAGGVVIELDGRPVRSLGSLGVVKRGIKLDPGKLLDGSAY